MVSDSRGDVSPGSIGGLVHEDTRFVSRWELRLDGRPLSLLKSGLVDYDSAAFFLAACMRSGRSGRSRRSAPKAMFAVPRASPLRFRFSIPVQCGIRRAA